MKTKLSVKNTPKMKPQSPGTKRRRQCGNEPRNRESGERKKAAKQKYFQRMLQGESPEQRARRLQKNREDRSKRLATETEEKALERRRLKALYRRNQRRNETPEQRLKESLQRKNKYREKREKLGHSIRPHRPYTNIRELLSNLERPEEMTSETTVQKYAITYGAQMKKVTKFDVVSNLLHAICRKYHSQCKPYQHQFFNSLTSSNKNDILVTIIWHKYRHHINSKMKNESLSQS